MQSEALVQAVLIVQVALQVLGWHPVTIVKLGHFCEERLPNTLTDFYVYLLNKEQIKTEVGKSGRLPLLLKAHLVAA